MNHHMWWNLGSSLSVRNQVEEHAMEAFIISCFKEIRDATISRQVDVDHLLGFSRPYSWDLPGTWNNYHKCNLLWYASEGLKPAICCKRRRLSEGILLLHDNSRPHTAACTLETLRKLKWEVMEHPAHSTDLAPWFSPFWTAYRGSRKEKISMWQGREECGASVATCATKDCLLWWH
jgi:hypothetical protein